MSLARRERKPSVKDFAASGVTDCDPIRWSVIVDKEVQYRLTGCVHGSEAD